MSRPNPNPDTSISESQFSSALYAFFQTLEWILRRWPKTILLPIVAGVGAYFIAVQVPSRYQAQTVLLIESGSDNAGAGLKALAGGDLGSLLGGKMSGKEEIPLLEVLLKGHELGSAMLQDTGVRTEQELDKKKLLAENELKAWHEKFGYEITEDGGVILRYQSKSPQRAMRMVQKVYNWMDSAVTTIKQSRAAKKLKASQEILSKREALLQRAEDSLLAFQVRNRIYAPTEQMQSSVQELAQLEVEKERTDLLRQLSIAEEGASSGKSRKLQELQNEIERKLQAFSSKSGLITLAPKEAMPKMFEYGRRLKQVHIHGAVISILTQQVEQYRLEVSKTVSPLYQVEPPMLPEKRSYPPRLAIAQAVLLLVFFLVVVLELAITNYRAWVLVKQDKQLPAHSKLV